MGVIIELFLSKVGSKFTLYSACVLKSGGLDNLCCKIMVCKIINLQGIIFNGSVNDPLMTLKKKHRPNMKTRVE